LKKLAPLIFGIGLGMFLVSAAMLFQGPEELSREEIEMRAERLGMGYREQFLLFPEENRRPPQDPGHPPASQAPTNSSATGNEGALLEVVISQGSTLTEAARVLFEAGLIAEPDIFVRKVQQMGLSQHLRAGTFRLSPGMDLEELVGQVTRAPRQKPPAQAGQQ